MASMWDRTQELAKQHDQDAGHWLKLQNNGDRALVVFLGEPFPREVCFIDNKYVTFTDKLKTEGYRSSLRIAFNVALLDTKEVKVLELGVVFFKDVVAVREKYGLEKWAFEVKRNGAPKDPKTTYSILPERQLTPEEQRAVGALVLHDLEKLYSERPVEDKPLNSFDKKAAQSVDPKTAQGIYVALKSLPREAVNRFLAKFGIEKVKDLPTSQLERAKAYVEILLEETSSSQARPEKDPFAD